MMHADDPEQKELLVIFQGSMDECKNRERILLEHGLGVQILLDEKGSQEYGSSMCLLGIVEDDFPVAQEIFQQLWEEVLEIEGNETSPYEVDLSQDTIVCPGCSETISELTEDGECPECLLFLGFPDEE